YDVKLEVGGYDVIKQYVQLGLGISIVMSHCLSNGDDLHAVSVSRYFDKRTYGVVLRKDKPLSPAANQFVDTILAKRKKKRRNREGVFECGGAVRTEVREGRHASASRRPATPMSNMLSRAWNSAQLFFSIKAALGVRSTL
ncbi:MAG: LysR family transcriptional regulator substrate-binding protein, partial [Bythopirellula sp.]